MAMILVLIINIVDFFYNQRFSFVSFVVGLVILIIGYVIRFRSRLQLGRFFAYEVKIRKDHKIIKRGFFKYVRHPMYTGTGIAFIGFSVMLNSLYGLASCLLLLFIGIYRIKVEEEALIKKFGSKYKKYCKETKMLIPFIW